MKHYNNFKITHMKKIFLSLIAILLISTSLNAQTGELSITTVNDGVNIDISIFVRRTGGTSWNMGEGSFVFNFNTSAVNIAGASVLTRGQWDVSNNTNYGSMFSASYGGVARSLETTLNVNPGSTIPATATLVGVLRLPITNASPNHNITWHTGFSAVQTDLGDEVTLNFVNPPNAPLPVELSSFTSMSVRNEVILDWMTATEINNSGFDIERLSLSQISSSKPDSIWNKIIFIEGSGNSEEQKHYKYNDKNLQAGEYKYRLKQIDYNGNYTYHQLENIVNVSVPKDFHLSQNYPNPFNPITKIDYELPVEGKVDLKIYDINGREVANLVNNETQPAGYYTVAFTAQNFSSGVYFFRMISQGNEKNFVMTKKMVLLK